MPSSPFYRLVAMLDDWFALTAKSKGPLIIHRQSVRQLFGLEMGHGHFCCSYLDNRPDNLVE
jgi:hypothetical protein